MFQCVHGKARRNDSSRRKGVAAYKKRNAYSKSRCQQQARKAETAGVFRGRFAESSRKLRGRVAPCLQASGHVVWVAQWSPSLHKLRRNTTSLKMTFLSAPMLAETNLVNNAPRKVCGSNKNNEIHVPRKLAEGTSWPAARMRKGPRKLEECPSKGVGNKKQRSLWMASRICSSKSRNLQDGEEVGPEQPKKLKTGRCRGPTAQGFPGKRRAFPKTHTTKVECLLQLLVGNKRLVPLPPGFNTRSKC